MLHLTMDAVRDSAAGRGKTGERAMVLGFGAIVAAARGWRHVLLWAVLAGACTAAVVFTLAERGAATPPSPTETPPRVVAVSLPVKRKPPPERTARPYAVRTATAALLAATPGTGPIAVAASLEVGGPAFKRRLTAPPLPPPPPLPQSESHAVPRPGPVS
jgi:hypothetical protein